MNHQSLNNKKYLAGPMTGFPEFNIPVFLEAKKVLEEQHGLTIQLPYDIDNAVQGGTWGQYLAKDVELICDECNGIILLPEWERSRGAKLEVAAGLMQYLKYPEFEFYEYFPNSKTNLRKRSAGFVEEVWHDYWDWYR